ncbi:hypothetical protein ACFSX5_13620 [Devosia albogilva]|uniref:GGDEF domain-containing protein n=1 Tax=Devosia albogilva TaxID=429726 RepID=A0ABW5QMG3_9HYPH
MCYLDLDLDHTEVVNERADHANGDEVLVRAAELVRGSCGSSGHGRIGAAFILLFGDCRLEQARGSDRA